MTDACPKPVTCLIFLFAVSASILAKMSDGFPLLIVVDAAAPHRSSESVV
jgi:hypothetical protein